MKCKAEMMKKKRDRMKNQKSRSDKEEREEGRISSGGDE